MANIERHKIRGYLVAFLALLCLPVAFNSTALARPSKHAALVIHENSGKVLYAQSPDARKYPASLTKIMTLYLLFDALEHKKVSLRTEWTASAHAAAQAPSKLGLKPGDKISVKTAILALVTKSANDVAVVVAEGLAGNEPRFARWMTSKARQLGMHRTTFRNASGLPNKAQLTTARDMAKLAHAIRRDFPQYFSYFQTEEFDYRGRRYGNHNKLLGRVDGVDGIKTGYTRASGFNLVSTVHRNGQRLIAVVFGGRTARARDKQMNRLIELGFRRAEKLPHTSPKALKARQSGQIARLAPKPEIKPVAMAQRHRARRLADSGAAAGKIANSDTVVPAVKPRLQLMTASATTVRPPKRPEPAGRWAVQVGVFRVYANASSQIKRAEKLAVKTAESPLGRIEKVNYAQDELYRTRLIGLSEGEASKTCDRLKAHDLDCRVLTPDDRQAAAPRDADQG